MDKEAELIEMIVAAVMHRTLLTIWLLYSIDDDGGCDDDDDGGCDDDGDDDGGCDEQDTSNHLTVIEHWCVKRCASKSGESGWLCECLLASHCQKYGTTLELSLCATTDQQVAYW